MKIMISTTVDAIIHQSAKDNLVAWNDAVEFGIKFLIADRQGFDYPDCNLSRKLQNITKLLQEKCAELEELKYPPTIDQEHENLKKEIAKREADDILKEIGATS